MSDTIHELKGLTVVDSRLETPDQFGRYSITVLVSYAADSGFAAFMKAFDYSAIDEDLDLDFERVVFPLTEQAREAVNDLQDRVEVTEDDTSIRFVTKKLDDRIATDIRTGDVVDLGVLLFPYAFTDQNKTVRRGISLQLRAASKV